MYDGASFRTIKSKVHNPEAETRKSRAAWFTERADKNFYEFMTQFMSSRVEGAIGGNVLLDMGISIDYPRAKAWVQWFSYARLSDGAEGLEFLDAIPIEADLQ